MNTENQYKHTNGGDSFTLSKTQKRTKRMNNTTNASTSGKVIEPLQPNQAKMIGPAQMAPRSSVLIDLEKSSRTRNDYKKLRTADSKSSSEPNTFTSDNPPRTDNLSQVLVQALQNSDKRMLDTVLCAKDDKIVYNTLSSLPIELIDPLLRELQKCLYYKGEQTLTYMKWLETLIQTKLSFILTVSRSILNISI